MRSIDQCVFKCRTGKELGMLSIAKVYQEEPIVSLGKDIVCKAGPGRCSE